MHIDTHTYRHTHTGGLQMGLVCFAVEGTFASGSPWCPVCTVCTVTSLVLINFCGGGGYGCSKAPDRFS